MSMYLVFALSFLMTFFETKNFKIVRDGDMKHIFKDKQSLLHRPLRDEINSWDSPYSKSTP